MRSSKRQGYSGALTVSTLDCGGANISVTSADDRCLPKLADRGLELRMHEFLWVHQTGLQIVHSQVTEQQSTILQIPLLETDSHGEKSSPRDFGSSLPLRRPLWQLSLMENMGVWDCPPRRRGIWSARNIMDRVRERASGCEGETTTEDGSELGEQHDDGERDVSGCKRRDVRADFSSAALQLQDPKHYILGPISILCPEFFSNRNVVTYVVYRGMPIVAAVVSSRTPDGGAPSFQPGHSIGSVTATFTNAPSTSQNLHLLRTLRVMHRDFPRLFLCSCLIWSGEALWRVWTSR